MFIIEVKKRDDENIYLFAIIFYINNIKTKALHIIIIIIIIIASFSFVV